MNVTRKNRFFDEKMKIFNFLNLFIDETKNCRYEGFFKARKNIGPNNFYSIFKVVDIGLMYTDIRKRTHITKFKSAHFMTVPTLIYVKYWLFMI